MATILAGMVILAIGWVGFLIFVLPVLAAAKVIQVSREDKNGKDT
jgi:preprotein translocase subunit Sss1